MDYVTWLVVTFLIVGVLSLIFQFGYNPLTTIRNGRLTKWIPGPHESIVPFVGNALEFFNLPHHKLIPLFLEWYGKFGTIFKVRIFRRLYIIIANPDYAQQILSSSKHVRKSKDYDVLGGWLGQGLLTSNGDKWLHRRKLLGHTFQQYNLLPGFCQVFNEQSQILMAILEKIPTQRSFDISPYLRRYALDVICETGMSTKLGSQKQTDLGYLVASNRITEIVYQKILEPWICLPLIGHILPVRKEEVKCLNVLHSITNKIILERQEEREKLAQRKGNDDPVSLIHRRTFLDFLLDQVDNGIELNDVDLRDEMNTFIFGGHDTIAASLSWTILLLGMNPKCQRKLQSELDSLFEDRSAADMSNITLQDISRMKYLDCCIKEALRIFPAVPAYNRVLEKPVILEDGKILPSGAIISINVFLLHRNPEIFPNPERFDPDRFLPENCNGRHPYACLPFSAGPRNCIGKKFALMEEKIVLANLSMKYDIQVTQEQNSVRILWDLVLRPMDGVVVTLTKRNKSEHSE